MQAYLGIMAGPLIARAPPVRLVRTYTDRHGLKELVKEMLGTDISKQQQTSDWGGPELNDAQRDYAASDVRYLHRLKDELDKRLAREKRTELAQACFDFLPARARCSTSRDGPSRTFSRMSEAAIRTRESSATGPSPAAGTTGVVRLAKFGLPMRGARLVAMLAIAPFDKRDDVSFILDKKGVDKATERMRIERRAMPARTTRATSSSSRPTARSSSDRTCRW